MLPSAATIVVAAIADAELWHERIGFWSRVYGWDMSHMAR